MDRTPVNVPGLGYCMGLERMPFFFFLTPHKDIRHSAVDKMSMKYLNIDDLIVTHDCIFVMTSLVECIFVVFSL